MGEPRPPQERRSQVLDAVQRADAPVGVSEVARELGVHPNTARFHLEALVRDGIVERVPGASSGPGRPPVGYRARPGLARGSSRRYRVLAEILLGQLSTTAEPAAAATAAGRVWGAHVVPRPASFSQVDAAESVARLTAMLDEMDFAPEPVGGDPGLPERLRLRHCPFFELAEPYRELVCSVHLGLMQGALAELNSTVTIDRLVPFAEPAACLAHLGTGAG